MENCVFCKIVAGEVPADKTFEDDTTLAFLDINPKATGHTLLIPKAHYPWFTDLPAELSAVLFRNASDVAKGLKKKYEADYVRLGIVGTDVPHTHIHLIPLHLKNKPDGMDAV
jgi:histidine triad (HIT) family protein